MTNILPFPGARDGAQAVLNRIAVLEGHRDHMAQANALLAAGDHAGLMRMGYAFDQIKVLQMPDASGATGYGFQAFEEIEKKIADLRRSMTVPPVTSAPGFDGRAPA